MWSSVRKGGGLPAQAEHLVDVLLPEPAEKTAVFLRHAAVSQFLLCAQVEVQPEVKGQRGPLRIQQHLEKVEEAQGTVPLGGGVAGVGDGIQQGAGHLIGIVQPALRRLRGDPVQQGAEDIQRIRTGDAMLDGAHPPEQLMPVRAAEKGGSRRLVHAQLLEKRRLRKGVRRLDVQGKVLLSFHSSVSFRCILFQYSAFAAGKEDIFPEKAEKTAPAGSRAGRRGKRDRRWGHSVKWV